MSDTLCEAPIFDPHKKLSDPTCVMGHCGLLKHHPPPCMINVETRIHRVVSAEEKWQAIDFFHKAETLAPDIE